MAKPSPKPQTEQQQSPPPVLNLEDFYSQERPKTGKPIDWTNKGKIEAWLNGLKPGFYRYLAEKQFSAASSANLLTHHLYNYLTLYQGEIIGELLSEGAMEMLFSALGPIGSLWKSAYKKNIDWKMKWMANPLNAKSIYYYLRSLPERKAFEISLLPLEKALGIIAKGGGPFTFATYLDPYGRIRQKYIFTPLLKATQAAHILADGLDKLNNFSTDSFDPTIPFHKTWDEDNSPWRKDVNKVNRGLKTALAKLKQAQKSGDALQIAAAKQEINKILSKWHGKIWRNLLGNTARRLRSTERDPISYLLSLIAGTIWDITIGLILNTAKAAVLKIAKFIPGFKTLEAQLVEFTTSNRFLSTLRIGGSTLKNFVSGVFSPTTFASAYLGYRVATLITDSPVIAAVATGISTGLGAFYSISLKIASDGQHYYWIKQYERLKAASGTEALIKEKYLTGFTPGPFSNFAKYLAERPFLRLPINGFVLADLGVNIFGWNPLIAYPACIIGDWLLQTRRGWTELLTQDTWKIFGKTRPTPYFRLLNLKNPNSLAFRLYSKYLNIFYKGDIANVMFSSGIIERPWFAAVKKFTEPLKPYIKNFFNPGFFLGLSLAQYFPISFGPWSYALGAFTGSLAWNLSARALTSIFPKAFAGTAAGIARINAVGWTGFFIGSLLDLLIPGTQPLLPLLTSAAFVGIDIALALNNTSLINLFAGLISKFVAFTNGVPAGLAAYSRVIAGWATTTTIASLLTLPILFVSIMSAGLWTPMQELKKAGPQSASFLIDTSVQQLPNGNQKICSRFWISQPIFNQHLFLEHNIELQKSDYFVNLTDPAKTTSASRNYQPLQLVLDNWDNFNTESYLIERQNQIPSPNQAKLITSFLSLPSDQSADIFTFAQQDQRLYNLIQSFIKTLQAWLKDQESGTDYNLQLAKAAINLTNAQKNLLGELINVLNHPTSSNYSPPSNPINIPDCPENDADCLANQLKIKDIADSWDSFIESYTTEVNDLLSRYQKVKNLDGNDPELVNFNQSLAETINNLETEKENLERQLETLKANKDFIDKNLRKKFTDQEVKFLNTVDLNHLAQTDQEMLRKILKSRFGEIFSGSYYYLPEGTRYEVCVEAEADPNPTHKQQIFCSWISSRQQFGLADSDFAKSCITLPSPK